MSLLEWLEKNRMWFIAFVVVMAAVVITKQVVRRAPEVVVQGDHPTYVKYGHYRCDRFDAQGRSLVFSIEQTNSVAGYGPWTHACVYQ